MKKVITFVVAKHSHINSIKLNYYEEIITYFIGHCYLQCNG